MKEYAFKTSIVSVFRYSTGLVPWSLNELLEIYAMWSRAYTRFWWRRKSFLVAQEVVSMLRLFWLLAQKGVGIASLQLKNGLGKY